MIWRQTLKSSLFKVGSETIFSLRAHKAMRLGQALTQSIFLRETYFFALAKGRLIFLLRVNTIFFLLVKYT